MLIVILKFTETAEILNIVEDRSFLYNFSYKL